MGDGVATREERVSHYLCALPSCYVVAWSEVRLVLRSNAWLEWSTTRVALHYVTGGKPLYLRVESMGRWYILEGLPCSCFGESCRVSDDFGCLTTGGVSERPEVRHVIHAWLTRSSAVITCHVSPSGQTVDEVVESLAGWDIGEYLRVRIFSVACRVGDHLG